LQINTADDDSLFPNGIAIIEVPRLEGAVPQNLLLIFSCRWNHATIVVLDRKYKSNIAE
jgi:hypothetical protein